MQTFISICVLCYSKLNIKLYFQKNKIVAYFDIEVIFLLQTKQIDTISTRLEIFAFLFLGTKPTGLQWQKDIQAKLHL